jgi:hypothetical protein
MKQLLLIILIAFAGIAKGQTTTQEYNYCRNSFVEDGRSGRGYLQGYKPVNFFSDQKASSAVIPVLFNNSLGKTKAIILLATSPTVGTQAIVIPIGNNSEQWKTTFDDIAILSKVDKDLAARVSVGAMTVASSLTSRLDSK